MTAAAAITIAEEDRLRADLYNFLGLLLAAPPDEMLLAQIASLEGDDSDLGQGITSLAKLAKLSKPRTIEYRSHRPCRAGTGMCDGARSCRGCLKLHRCGGI